jgi:adenylate cyclase
MSKLPAYQRFFAELKRRKVFRVTAVYGAVSFGVLQAADILFPRIGLPDWTVTLVAALTLVGFPLALVLTWAYERTPDGVKRTDPAETVELEAIASAARGSRWTLGLAAIAGAALLAVGTWWVLARPDAAAAHSYQSIAVLPFVNMTGLADNEYLGDGLAEELLNALVRIDGLAVSSRTSAFAFKGSDAGATAIANSLGVETVLEGSVRGSAEVLRITAQLIDARTGFHVWSDTYDLAPADLLDIQDDLTARIVDALAVQFGGEEARPVPGRGTEDPLAYDYYLQGRYFWNKRTAEDLQIAVGLFEKAIAADSAFAPAYAAIADAYAVPAGWDADDAAVSLAQAERYARLALEIDPALAQAHSALAFVLMMRDLDLEGAEASFVRAIELDPNYATAHQWYSELLAATERDDEAFREVKRAEELDPTMIIRWNVVRVLYFAGRYDEAVAEAEPLVEEGGPYGDLAAVYQMLSYEMKGEYESAFEALSRVGMGDLLTADFRDSVRANAPDGPEGGPAAFIARGLERTLGEVGSEPDEEGAEPGLLFQVARAWAIADPERAFEFLTLMARDPDDVNSRVEWFNVLTDPAFDEMRDDPRYLKLNGRFGL